MQPTPEPLIVVLTSTATRDDAQRLAVALVEARLVACAQISAIDSVYRWDGALQQEPECRLLLKTTAARYAELEAAIRRLHPYALPAIYALPVAQASTDYAAWVAAESGGAG